MEGLVSDSQIEPTSAEKIAENEDLATELLIHIPATFLAPCLRVSKLWLSFISNQKFVSRHTLFNPPFLSGLFLISRQSPQHLVVQFLPLCQSKPFIYPFVSFINSKGFQILHSCNGLLLCQSGLSYYVCNPSTRQMRVIPSCSYMDKTFTLALAFDSLISPCYMVVCVQKLDIQQPLYQIAIYSSETRLWNFSQKPVSKPYDVEFKDGVYCNGAIHWLTNTSGGVYFDLKTKILTEMPPPPRQEEGSECKFKYFGKSQGHLLYVILGPQGNHYEIYQLLGDYSGWELKFRVNLYVLSDTFSVNMSEYLGFHPFFSESECEVLCILHAGSNEDTEIVLSLPGEVVFFNLKKKTSRKVQNHVFRPSDVTIWYKIYSIYEYFETLSHV